MGAACRNEEIMITQKVCKIEWEEECTTSKKKIGEKVVYDKKCEDREVNDCKWVQIVYQDFPSLGISGGPGKEYQECEMVTKEFCEDVPRNEDVEGDVETCVNTPKEVCEDGKQRAQKQICEKIKPQAAKPK
eukprot:TRINITY_DN4818_c0_g1_i1.p1 TRINITY_DN4818_c0_g1~~TRINITY_DN4818_c0_g1_i1.p1  ORF type:complete len:151 (-),score=79.45 TRINITY_DN4818_c0_g1_i1:198-593(-)